MNLLVDMANVVLKCLAVQGVSLWIQVAALNALRVQFGGNLYLLRSYLDP